MRQDEVAGAEPVPADPRWPRYSDRPLPDYRFVPGRGPHPIRDPDGHSYRRHPERQRPFPPDRWTSAAPYLYGIDCYNFAYWWEGHEVLEELWHAVGHPPRQGQFLQGLIQVAAAWLHRFRGDEKAAAKQVRAGLARLDQMPDLFMGVDVRALEVGVRQHLQLGMPQYPLIRLVGLRPVGYGPDGSGQRA